MVEGFSPPPEQADLWWSGNQVFNFFPCDKNYRNNPSAVACVEKYFQGATALNTDAAMIKFASDNATLDGAYLEMGVGSGKSINFIAALNPEKKIFGFDSFEGLPEDWQRKDVFIPKGSFKLRSEFVFPPVLHNVRLMKGMFHETLPKFKSLILKNTPIVSGTVLLFDEFYNYAEYANDEFRAFQEFLQESGKQARYIAFNQYWEQVAAVII